MTDGMWVSRIGWYRTDHSVEQAKKVLSRERGYGKVKIAGMKVTKLSQNTFTTVAR
jgi:hypothetical protein